MTTDILHKDDIKNKVEVFKQSPVFALLGEAELSKIAKLATPRYFEKGRFIFQEGDPPDFFFIVKQGRVKLFKETASGKNFVFSIAKPGGSLHSSVLFNRKPRWLSAQAMEEAIVLCVRTEEYLSFINNYPNVVTKMVDILEEQARSAYDRLIDMMLTTVEQRMLNVLDSLSSKFGNTLFFTCEELAELAGTTPETATRVMNELKSSGIVSGRRRQITVLDAAKLHLLINNPYLI